MPAQNFYRYNGSYYLADSHQQIANLQQLQQYAQAGGREISAPTIRPGSVAINGAQYGTSALQNANFSNIYRIGNTLYGNPLNQNINSGNVNTGSQYNNVGSQLPNGSASQTAINIYTQNALQNGQQSLQQLQQQYNQLSAQQLQQTQTNLQNTQSELSQLELQRQQDIDRYRSITDPLYQQGAAEYQRMLNSLGQIDYQALIKQRLELTQDIVNYSNLMRQELDTEAGRPALQSISQGRQSAIQQNYISKISTAQAATAAIDGNFNLAFDIMNRGATVIQNISADRLNFLNFVSGIYDSKIDDRRQRLVQLTADEKEQIDQLRTKLLNDIKTVEDNKKIIQNLMSNPETAMIAHKAGLTLIDTPDQVAEKLNKYYVQNPSLVPESIRELQTKFPDAGINYWDTSEQIAKKIANSGIYQQGTGTTLTAKDILDQAQELLNNGQAVDLNDAINQVQSALGGTPAYGNLVGQIGGQCGDFIHNVVSNVPALGDLWEQKQAKSNVSPKSQWQVGDVLIQKTNMPYGHVSVVTAVNGNKVTVLESNYNLDQKVGQRTITMGDPSVTGVYRGGSLKGVGNVNTPETESIRNSLQALLPRLTAEQKKSANSLVNQALKDGDIQRAKEAIITTSISALPVELQNKAFGRLVAIDALNDIQASLIEYKAKGGNTGIFTGTAEQITQKVGETTNPELAQIGNKIALSIIAYRSAVSGAAFTESEARAYEALFPSIFKGDELNTARITSLINTFNLNQRSTLSTIIGNSNYNSIFGNGNNLSLSDQDAQSLLSQLSGYTGGSGGQSVNPYSVYTRISNPYQF